MSPQDVEKDIEKGEIQNNGDLADTWQPPSPSSSHEEERELPAENVTTSRASAQQRRTSPRPHVARTISTQSKPASLRKVPLSARSGLFGRLSLLYEVEDPKGYPRNIKWLITFIIALAAVAAPMGSSIILRELVTVCFVRLSIYG